MDDRPNARCLNCDAPLAGPYCAQCGQKDLGTRVDLSELVGEFVSETFELEGRLPRTFLSLLFKPGDYLFRYLEGQRRSFSSPLRLYLLAAFVSVVVITWRVEGAATHAIRNGDLMIVPSEEKAGLNFEGGASLRARRAEQHVRDVLLETYDLYGPRSPEADHDLPRWWGTCEPEPFDWIASLQPERTLECIQEGKGIAAGLVVAVERLSRSGSPEDVTSRFLTLVLERIPLGVSALIAVYTVLLKLLWWRHPMTVHVLVAVTFHALVLYGVTAWMLWPTGFVLWLVHGWLQAHALFSLKAAYGSGWPRTFATYVALGLSWWVLAFFSGILAIVAGLFSLA